MPCPPRLTSKLSLLIQDHFEYLIGLHVLDRCHFSARPSDLDPVGFRLGINICEDALRRLSGDPIRSINL